MLVSAIDIGSGDIKCLIMEYKDGKAIIHGRGVSPAEGIEVGHVGDIELAGRKLAKAIKRAENVSAKPMEVPIVTYNGTKIRSYHKTHHMRLNEDVIEEKDLKRIKQELYNQITPKPDYQLLHLIPLHYRLDQQTFTRSPLHLSARELSITANVIEVDQRPIRNIHSLLETCSLKPSRIVLAPFAAAHSVLNKDERDEGAITLDFGAQTTGIAVYEKNRMIYAAVIPFGMNAVRDDIAKALKCTRQEAENLMKRQGHTQPSQKDYNTNIHFHKIGDDVKTHKHREALNSMNGPIRARIEDIFIAISTKLHQAGFQNLQLWSIVLTGGGTNLGGMALSVQNYFKAPVRVGTPNIFNEHNHPFAESTGATISGLMDFYHQNSPVEDLATGMANYDGQIAGLRHRLASWFKNHL